MENRIIAEDVYSRQLDTMIVWVETDGRDLGLSFQEVQDCDEIWQGIIEVQRHIQPSGSVLHIDSDSEVMHEFPEDIVLPEFKLETLEELAKASAGLVQTVSGRNRLNQMVHREKLVGKLCEMFEMAEDMGMEDVIVYIFCIMKNLVALNEQHVLESFMSDENILRVCGIFEYDAEYPVALRVHRDFMSDSTRFKKIADFNDAALERKIHMTFRGQFLKDVLLARIIEDSHFSAISSMVLFNQVEILNSLGQNQTLLNGIFSELRNNTTPASRKELILQFTQDVCNTAKNIQLVNRQTFYRALASNGILQELPKYFNSEKDSIKITVADIIVNFIEYDPNMLRSFILTQHKHGPQTFLDDIIQALIKEPDLGLKFVYADIIRLLLEWPMMSKDRPNDQDADEKADFLHLFFAQYFTLLVAPLQDLSKFIVVNEFDKSETLVIDKSQQALCHHIVDILCFMLKSHTHRTKFPLLKDDLLQRSTLLLLAPSNVTKIIAVKLLRTLVGAKDEFYNRFIVKQDLLKRFMIAFNANSSRYNLFNSVSMNLLEFLLENSIKSLIVYLAEKYRFFFQSITYHPLGVGFMLRYTQLTDLSRNAAMSEVKKEDRTGLRGWARQDKDEEAYFNEDSDGVDSPYTSVRQETILDLDSPIAMMPKRRLGNDDDEALFSQRLTNIGGKTISRSSPMFASAILSKAKAASPVYTPFSPERTSESGNMDPISDDDDLSNNSSSPTTPARYQFSLGKRNSASMSPSSSPTRYSQPLSLKLTTTSQEAPHKRVALSKASPMDEGVDDETIKFSSSWKPTTLDDITPTKK